MHKSFTKQHLVFLVHNKTYKKPLALIRQRFFLWFLVSSVLLLGACSSKNANAYNYSIKPEKRQTAETETANKRVKVLSSYLIKSKTKNSYPIVELSDLAWDEDEQLLYAISDEGLLYHLKLNIKNNRINSVNIIDAMPIRDKQNQAVKGKFSDAEGLALIKGNNKSRGDTELIISFENKPRIAHYSTNGQFIKKVKIIKKLRKRKYFRNKNKALESVTVHPQYGYLTAAEKPLKENPLSRQTIYSNSGKEWHFPASTVKNSSITALEVISKDEVLILERAYNGLLSPVVINLRKLTLQKCDHLNLCEIETLARLDSSEGWILDNFEGLTHLRDNQYLMISDNNNNPLQKTILVLFEILNQ